MQTIVPGLLRALSFLPWWMIYGLSNLAYLVLYYLVGYRKKVVMQNLAIAFPEKTQAQRKRIAKQTFRNICDTFLETLKMASISKEELEKRVVMRNIEHLHSLIAEGKTVNLLAGHFLNFEYGNIATAAQVTLPFVGVYMPIKAKPIDDFIFNMRSRFGTKMIPATGFKEAFAPYENIQHAIGLVGDQSTGNLMGAYWMHFFGKITPFAQGPYKASHQRNTAVILFSIHHTKRGYYELVFEPLCTHAADHHPHWLALQTRNWLEETIRRYPADYLWTHRRWKRPYDAETFGHLLVE